MVLLVVIAHVLHKYFEDLSSGDVDESVETRDRCSGTNKICIKFLTSYECMCNDGFTLINF